MNTRNPEELIQKDSLLSAIEAAKSLPEGDPARGVIEANAGHVVSQEAYRTYYRTMRGGVCPEDLVFRRHEQVKRFSVIRRLILERGHKTVLDLGCLDGWCLLNLAASGIVGVGVDLCSEALAVGQRRAAKWGFRLSFIEASIEDFDLTTENPADYYNSPVWPETSRFDAVILSEVLEHVMDPVACFRTAVRHLKSSGIVYVSVPATPVPHHGKIEDAREHLRVYKEEDLILAAKAAGLAKVVDHELIPERDAETGEEFANRTISFRRAAITVYCNHVTGGWSPLQPDDLSGSEEMVVKVAEAWARQGHEVIVHQNGPDKGPINGVIYRERSISPDADRDLLVLFKTLEHADTPAAATVFWTTDLPAQGSAASFLPPRLANQFKVIACISEYHRAQLLAACPWIDPEKVKAHWLGVDPAEMASVRQIAKIPGRVFYASSPDRGLAQLLDAWPAVRTAVPAAELHVAYGFDFWIRSEAVLPTDQAEAMRQMRRQLEKLLKTLPGVTFLGRRTRADFLRELGEAQVWAYPCTGGELCCKTALEAQAAGCEPVVVPTMALAETVQRGCLSTHDPGRFTKDLIETLQGQHSVPFDFISTEPSIPTWEDLANWLWGFAGTTNPVAKVPEVEPVPVSVKPSNLPERFFAPSRVAAPQTGLDMLFCVAGMPFDGNTDRERSLGGSETAAIQLCRELQRRGHRVTVFANLPQGGQPGKFDGVSYLPIQNFAQYAGSTPHDITIVQRDPSALNQPLQSKMNLLWCHDLGLARYRPRFRASLWNVDYLVPVSHWHGRQLCEVYDLPPENVVPMRNGIDLEAIQRSLDRRTARDRNAVVFAGRPERGLDLLLQAVFPRLLERNPKLVLYLAGYDNTVEEMREFYGYCHAMIANLGPRAKWLGHLKKAELYAVYSRARAYLYPTRNFKEVFCISAAEAAACGLPFVGTTLGALPEVTNMVPGFARLVEHPGQAASEEFINRFVEAAWDVISDDVGNKRMSEAGFLGARAYSWVDVAKEWEDFLIGALEQRSGDKRRLARHWWKLGDFYGTEQALKAGELDAAEVGLSGYPPAASTEYDFPPPTQGVINALVQAAADVKPKTVLGLGKYGLEAAKTIAAAIGAEAISGVNEQAVADFVFGVETLDCSPDPTQHVKDVEALTTPNGHLCFVTAIPGTYQDRLHRKEPRGRRWVFDQHDIRDLFGQRPDLLAMIIGVGAVSAYDGMPLGWALYRTRRGTGPVGAIDQARRLWLQSPRLSLSGCMIVKNGEAMLHRCLKSILPYCDEVVVDDNGSTDSTAEILAAHGIVPTKGPSPLDVGFDEARNANIARATGDLILWVDADEELLDGFQLPKYLRWNIYNGYGICQHHFSAVPPNAFKPDMPVRLFRRVKLDGTSSGIRFFGVVHEHPELAINQSVGQSVVLSDVNIAHDGYLTETGRRKRFDRNIPLMFRDRVKYPDRLLGKFLMIRDFVHLARYELERNGRRLSPQGAAYLESALDLYRRDFLGRTHMMAMDGLSYYNEALQFLNRGFEAQVSIKVGGLDGAPHDFVYNGRVASQEDLKTMADGAAADLASIWQGEYI